MVVVKFKTTEENKVSMLLAILFSIILIVNFLQKEISCKILDFLGNMSYTVYITHLATIYLFKSLLFNFEVINSSMISQWYIWPIGVIIAIIVSFLIYQIAEKPSKILLQNIRNKKNVLKFAQPHFLIN